MSGLKRERGAAAVEFAILLPLLMMLLLAIMEFGYAFFLQASVASAARLGVRSYAINWSDKDKGPTSKTTAINLAKSAVPTASAVVDPVSLSSCQAGMQTTLILVYKYQSLTGLLDGLLGNKVTITGQGSMQCGG